MAYNYPFAFPPSKRFRTWAQNLRLSFTGKKKMLLSFASVLGDKSLDWATQAVLEHFPEYASAPSLALLANERQIDTAPNEAAASVAARLPYWIFLNRLRGTPLGLCIALYYAGFPNAVVVGQNGLSVTLSGIPTISDIVALVQGGTVPSWVAATNVSVLATPLPGFGDASNPMPTIPAGTPWWTLDGKTGFCSRFTLLFPGPLPGPFLTWGVATFAGTDVAALVWNNSFPDTTYAMLSPSVTTSGALPVVTVDPSTKTTTGITLNASFPFTGTAEVVAYQIGNNPFCDLHAADLTRLRNIIASWKPAKATCKSINALAQGRMWGWPPTQNWGTGVWGGTVVTYSP